MKPGYFEVARPRSTRYGVCSDNQCPCDEDVLSPGNGYLYISEDLVQFRKDALTLQETEKKVLTYRRQAILIDKDLYVPILMCKQGAIQREIDMEIGATDIDYFWETGLVPLRPTPLNKSRISSSSSKQYCGLRRLGEGIVLTSWKTVGVSILAVCGLLVLVSCSGDDQSSSPPSYPYTFSAPVASQSETIPKQPLIVPTNRSLPSSTVLVSPAKRGRGSLKVSNGTNRDAYIKLVDPHSRKLVAAFYVKSNSTLKLKKVPDGTYQVLFVLGEDWDSKTRSFTRSKRFAKFDRSLDFTTTRSTNRIQYRVFELTLNSVFGGNATSSEVNDQEFAHY